MSANSRVLVVGTTPDYIALLSRRYPGRVLFVTDRTFSHHREMPDLTPEAQVYSDLSSLEDVVRAVRHHADRWRLRLSGITCYDCEWLRLTAQLARRFGLEYSSESAVALCRDKYLSRSRWLEAGVDCPRVRRIATSAEAVDFANGLAGSVVLKPVSGSGSELVFHCTGRDEVVRACETLKKGLSLRRHHPMFNATTQESVHIRADANMVAEEYIEGEEYSCDILVEDGVVTIIRIARKLKSSSDPFGTTRAYVCPAALPLPWSNRYLANMLRRATEALGISRAICMVDFIVGAEKVYLLELTPRPGGDCLPPLIRHSCGLDMLKLALDVAEHHPISIPPADEWAPMVGLRFFARSPGTIARLDAGHIRSLPKVREVVLKRMAGDRVVLPPDDYDSWLLGHAIFAPDLLCDIQRECESLNARLIEETVDCYDKV